MDNINTVTNPDQTQVEEALTPDERMTGNAGAADAAPAVAPAGGQAAQDGGQETPEGAGSEKQKPEQSLEERARNAEARRLREREQRAFERAYRQAREEASAVIRSIGMANPDTNAAIQNLDELETYADELSKARLALGQANEDDIRRVTRQVIREERGQTAPPTPKASRGAPEDDPVIRDELAQIRSMDPEMKDLPTILRSEAGPRFRAYVARGMTFLEAYTLAAQDRIQTIAANRKAAKGGGKGHLTPTQQRGEGAIDVPPEVMAQFHAIVPDATDEAIRKYYAADRKRFGR